MGNLIVVMVWFLGERSSLTSTLDDLQLKKKFPDLYREQLKTTEEISKSLENLKEKIKAKDSKQPDVRSNDSIRERIYELSENNVGNPPRDQDWLDKIYQLGEQRYEKLIPPGFKDASKEKDSTPDFIYNGLTYQRKFGDLILWIQIKEKINEEKTKNVFFITDDAKEDWWQTIDSRGKKIIGPHESLCTEIYNDTSTTLFHMYNTSDFLNAATEFLGRKLHKNTIEDSQSGFFDHTIAINNESLMRLHNEQLELEKSIDYLNSRRAIIDMSKSNNEHMIRLHKLGLLDKPIIPAEIMAAFEANQVFKKNQSALEIVRSLIHKNTENQDPTDQDQQ